MKLSTYPSIDVDLPVTDKSPLFLRSFDGDKTADKWGAENVGTFSYFKTGHVFLSLTHNVHC